MKALQDAASQNLSIRREDVYAESYNPFLDQCCACTMRISNHFRDSTGSVLSMGALRRHFLLEHNDFSEAFNNALAHRVLLDALSQDLPDQSYLIGFFLLPVELGIACVHGLEALRDLRQSSSYNPRDQRVRGWSLCLLNGTTFGLYLLSRSILLPVWHASYTQKVPVDVGIAMVFLFLVLAKRISSSYSTDNPIILLLLQLGDYVPETLRTATALSVMRPQETDLHLLLAAMVVQFVVYMGGMCAFFMPGAEVLKLLQAWMLTGSFMTSLVHDTDRALWHPSKSDYSPYLPAFRVGMWIVLLLGYLFILRHQYRALLQNTVEAQNPVSDQRTVKDQGPSQPAAAVQHPPLIQPLLSHDTVLVLPQVSDSNQPAVGVSPPATAQQPPVPILNDFTRHRSKHSHRRMHRPMSQEEFVAQQAQLKSKREQFLNNRKTPEGLRVASENSFLSTPAATPVVTSNPTSSDISEADDAGPSSSLSLRP